MTPEEAWDQAMKLEHRANPYPFFDELRQTPVARVTNGVYAVTGYEELIALAHDPRVSSDIRRSPIGARPREITDPSIAEMIEQYGQDLSFIQQDPPDHDRARRSCMRYFGPPHSPDVSPARNCCVSRLSTTCSTRRSGRPALTWSTTSRMDFRWR